MLTISTPKGIIYRPLNAYQLKIYDAFNEFNNVVAISPRQSGSSTIIAYLTYVHQNKKILILSDCTDMVKEIKRKFEVFNNYRRCININYRSVNGIGINFLHDESYDIIIFDNYSFCKLTKNHTDRIGDIANDDNKKLLLVTTISISQRLNTMFIPENTKIIRY